MNRDLGVTAMPLVHTLDQTDWRMLVLPILVLLFIGNKATKERAYERSLGLGLASMVFLLELVRRFLSGRQIAGEDLPEGIFHSLAIAGLVLGIAWIGLPVAVRLWDRTVGAMFRAAIRLLKAVLAGFLYPVRAVHRWRSERDFRKASREEEIRRHSERERARKEQESHQARLANDKARRDEARAVCDGLYAICRHALLGRFGQSEFDAFKAEHMGPDRSPDYVERRGMQLQDIIVKHVAELKPAAVPYDEIGRWYNETLAAIQKLPGDDKLKRVQIARLNGRFADLLETRLEE